IQYFASLVVVDNEQEDRSFLAWARPTVETAVVKGDVTSVAEDGKSFKVKGDDKTELTMQLRGGPVVRQHAAVGTGATVRVVYRADECEGNEVLEVHTAGHETRLLFDDIAVRLVSEKLDLEPGKAVTHKYLLYNGPAKVRLMHQLGGERKVDPALIDRYEKTL